MGQWSVGAKDRGVEEWEEGGGWRNGRGGRGREGGGLEAARRV